MKLSTVLFDLDGTLTDPKVGITRCIRFSLGLLGASPPDEDRLEWCIGPPLKASFRCLLNTDDEALVELAINHYRKRFSEIGIFENAVYPGITDSLRRIRNAGFLMLLATSKPRIYAARILKHFGLDTFFHAVHGSELDGRLADKGELIAHIIATEGCDPAGTLMVGDRLHDVAGGKKNGIATAAVTYGYGSREELAKAGPDLLFDSPAALASFLCGEGRGEISGFRSGMISRAPIQEHHDHTLS